MRWPQWIVLQISLTGSKYTNLPSWGPYFNPSHNPQRCCRNTQTLSTLLEYSQEASPRTWTSQVGRTRCPRRAIAPFEVHQKGKTSRKRKTSWKRWHHLHYLCIRAATFHTEEEHIRSRRPRGFGIQNPKEINYEVNGKPCSHPDEMPRRVCCVFHEPFVATLSRAAIRCQDDRMGQQICAPWVSVCSWRN